MSILGRFSKQMAETESFTISYREDMAKGDGLLTVDFVVEPSGLTIVRSEVAALDARVWLSGGTVGSKYKITATASTGDGRVLQDEFFLTIKEY